MILLLVLGRGQVPQRFQQALRVEPGDPLERRELDVVEAAPGPGLANDLRLEQPDHRLGERVVVRVAAAADRGLDARLRQPLGVPNRQVLHAAVAVMHEPASVSRS